MADAHRELVRSVDLGELEGTGQTAVPAATLSPPTVAYLRSITDPGGALYPGSPQIDPQGDPTEELCTYNYVFEETGGDGLAIGLSGRCAEEGETVYTLQATEPGTDVFVLAEVGEVDFQVFNDINWARDFALVEIEEGSLDRDDVRASPPDVVGPCGTQTPNVDDRILLRGHGTYAGTTRPGVVTETFDGMVGWPPGGFAFDTATEEGDLGAPIFSGPEDARGLHAVGIRSWSYDKPGIGNQLEATGTMMTKVADLMAEHGYDDWRLKEDPRCPLNPGR